MIRDIDISLGDGLQEGRLKEVGNEEEVSKGTGGKVVKKSLGFELTFPDPFSPRRPYLKCRKAS